MPSTHPLYNTWSMMIQRCENPNHGGYIYYGGKGVKVCEHWRLSFRAFAEDMGDRPAGYTLDRINRNGNYEPGNCRWADRKTQNLNKGKTNRRDIVTVITYALTIVDRFVPESEREEHTKRLHALLD